MTENTAERQPLVTADRPDMEMRTRSAQGQNNDVEAGNLEGEANQRSQGSQEVRIFF